MDYLIVHQFLLINGCLFNAPEVFMDQYIEPGSIGLQTFYPVRMNKDVVKQIITHLLLGQFTDPIIYEFGEAREEDLWKHFYAQMGEEDFED